MGVGTGAGGWIGAWQCGVAWMTLSPCRAAGCPITGPRAFSDQALAESVGDGLGAIAQVEPAGDIVDDVLDSTLGVEEPAADLSRVQPLGQQLEHLDLAVG